MFSFGMCFTVPLYNAMISSFTLITMRLQQVTGIYKRQQGIRKNVIAIMDYKLFLSRDVCQPMVRMV